MLSGYRKPKGKLANLENVENLQQYSCRSSIQVSGISETTAQENTDDLPINLFNK